MPIEAIIFDLDGLMVDSEPLAKRAWRTMLARHGHTLDKETLGAMFGLRPIDGARLVRDRFSLDLTVEQVAAEKRELFLALVAAGLEPRPGLKQLLNAIDVRGLARAVATSGERDYVPVALDAVGITNGFRAIVTGDDVRNGKPAPDTYLQAAAAINLSPTVCLALEDSPLGVQSAQAAGMACIAVPNEMTAELDLSAADWILPSLAVVAERLDEFLQM